MQCCNATIHHLVLTSTTGVPTYEQYELCTHIANDSQVCQHVENFKPDADVLGTLSHNATGLTDKLLSIKPDLHPVVEQCEQWGQGEGSNEDGDEAKLKHWNTREAN